MKSKFVIATVAAAAVIGGGTLTGVAFAGDDGGQSSSSSPQVAQRSSVQLGAGSDDQSDAKENSGKAAAAKISAADAAKAALKQQPGTVTGIDLEDEDGGALVWETDVLGKDGKWHNVLVDPGNGKVLGSHTERGGDDHGDDGDHGKSYVRQDLKGTSVDAVAAAEKGAAKGTVTSVDLEDGDDHGASGTVWEVDAVAGHGVKGEFTVDAHTGKIAKAADDDSDDDGQGDDGKGDDDGKADHDDHGKDDHDHDDDHGKAGHDDDRGDHDKGDHDGD